MLTNTFFVLSQAEAVRLHTGRSFGLLGAVLRIGFRSKKLTGLRSKLDSTVGMIGKSSWHGIWWNPNVYHNTTSLFSIGLSLQQTLDPNSVVCSIRTVNMNYEVLLKGLVLPVGPDCKSVFAFILIYKQPSSPFFASIVRSDPYLVISKCASLLRWII